jgi:hypothetical protein
MRPDLDDALVRDFPCLFHLRHQHGDGPREPISFGFEIEDGWEGIVRGLAEKLDPVARQTSLFEFVQAVEKSMRRLRYRGSFSVDHHNGACDGYFNKHVKGIAAMRTEIGKPRTIRLDGKGISGARPLSKRSRPATGPGRARGGPPRS